jgi:hypothetical protein
MKMFAKRGTSVAHDYHFVSRFTCICREYETRTLFQTVSPMKYRSEKTMKRDGTKTGALVSSKARLVSLRFAFRFTPSFSNPQSLFVRSFS